jgi:HAD superfamily hydrolase (TIGR01509 family)
MAIRGVIFDVDGTLIDSNDGHARAWVDALAEFGHEVTYERVRPLIGMGGDKVLPELTGLRDESDEGKEIAERREAIFRERYLPQVKALPGARELLVRLRDDGFRLAVASSSKKEMLKKLLALVGAEDLLETKTSSDDADNSKPDPDIVEAARKRLDEPADRCVMIGDTPYDVEASLRARIRPIGFRSGGWKDPDLKGALEVYDGPRDLLDRLESSMLTRERER